jgi:hypothetical protein
MKWLLITLFSLSLWTSTAAAQQELLIGPAEAEPGKLVILDASDIPSSGRTWQAIACPPDSFEVADDGHRLFFATSKPGRYWFVFSYTDDVDQLIQETRAIQSEMARLLAAKEPLIEELSSAQQGLDTVLGSLLMAKTAPHSLVHELVITGSIPDDDRVSPTPDPVIPDGRYKLALLSRSEAMKLSDRDGMDAVAGAYRLIAERITRGELKSVSGRFGEAIILATGKLLSETLTSTQAKTWSPWGGKVSSQITLLQTLGDIKADGDMVTAYIEIATGLDSIDREKKPEPDPEPVKLPVAWIVIIEETAARTPATAKVTADLKFWESIEAQGIKFRQYDDDSEGAEQYRSALNGVPMPAVLFLDVSGKILDKFPLPADTAGIERKLKR